MHCFECGEILDHAQDVIWQLTVAGHICVHCDAPFIWCGEGRHTVEMIRGGVWGHTCPHHKPGPRLRGRSQAPAGSSYLITPCTTDRRAGGPSKS